MDMITYYRTLTHILYLGMGLESIGKAFSKYFVQ